MTIRMATLQDCPAVRAIYGQYIDTPITFECVLPPQEAFAERMAGILTDYPYLVCEEQNRVVGYAYAHRQMERAAYQWNAELSVYIDRGCTSKGLGTALYGALEELLRRQGVHTLYGGVTVPNEKSRRLHLGRGFVSLGIYHRTGYKNGAWHDVEWFEKAILPYGADPAPVRPIRELEPEEIRRVLGAASEHP